MQLAAGTYAMRISPKSGNPVFGHTDVNSGQLMAISYSRSGRGLGNVSIIIENLTAFDGVTRLTVAEGRARIRRFSSKTAGLAARATTGRWSVHARQVRGNVM